MFLYNMIFIFGCVCKIRMDKFKDKIIGYKTYYFNMIFSQNTKIILQNHIQIRFYIRKQEKLGYKKSPP